MYKCVSTTKCYICYQQLDYMFTILTYDCGVSETVLWFSVFLKTDVVTVISINVLDQ